MATIKRKGNKAKYDFLDCDCLGRECFVPGMFQHYNKSITGANSVTNQTPECISRAYHGCDLESNPFVKELAQERIKKGWKCSK